MAFLPDDEPPPSGGRMIVEIMAMIAASLAFGLMMKWLVRFLGA